MTFQIVKDRELLANYLLQDTARHIYEIGDLDDFYFPYTTWYCDVDHDKVKQLALVYRGTDLPVLLVTDGSPDRESLTVFYRSMIHNLPLSIYAHLLPGVDRLLSVKYSSISHGKHWKMVLNDKAKLLINDELNEPVLLSRNNLQDIQDFYTQAYPGNWFDERMLETNKFYGAYTEGKLVSVAGIHVFSPKYKVAAIGNIATLPMYRGKGWGTRVTSRLCQSLLSDGISTIGLNVLQNNVPAIASYKKLGFEIIAEYEEFMLDTK